MAQLGNFALILGLALSLYGIVVFIVGGFKKNNSLLESGRGAVLSVAILSTVSIGVLLYSIMTKDYSLKYVYDYTSNDLPVFYRFSALWAGNEGSLLLWLVLLSWYTVVVAFSKKTRHLTPYASTILLINSAFFLLLLVFVKETSPFTVAVGAAAQDGIGMNPQLQNVGMVFHPVTLYLGYVGFSVPFAYAMTALLTRSADDEWIRVTRRWTIVAWLFLSLGNLWGAQWAYTELGWGGYWAWDPVENASFIPWLTGSAFLHSVMVQERKDMLKIWNVMLIALTYILTLFGTYLVRGGPLASVHAFPSSILSSFFLSFIFLMLFGSLFLIVDRRKMLAQQRDFESVLSKESSFLLNNLILVGLAVAIFWGTMFPKFSEVFMGNKINVGADFFNKVSSPLGLLLFLLMGICPLIAWRKASVKNLRDSFMVPGIGAAAFAILLLVLGMRGFYQVAAFAIAFFTVTAILMEIISGMLVRNRLTGEPFPQALGRLLVRNRRRHGGYIIHLGLVMMLIGITGSHAFTQETIKNLKPGETVTISDYSVKFNKLDEKIDGTKDILFASMSVYEKGVFAAVVEPQVVTYNGYKGSNQTSEVGLLSTLKQDLYIVLSDWKEDGSATFKVKLNPLVKWLWIGGYVLVLGTIFALWPGKGSNTGSKFLRQV